MLMKMLHQCWLSNLGSSLPPNCDRRVTDDFSSVPLVIQDSSASITGWWEPLGHPIPLSKLVTCSTRGYWWPTHYLVSLPFFLSNRIPGNMSSWNTAFPNSPPKTWSGEKPESLGGATWKVTLLLSFLLPTCCQWNVWGHRELPPRITSQHRCGTWQPCNLIKCSTQLWAPTPTPHSVLTVSRAGHLPLEEILTLRKLFLRMNKCCVPVTSGGLS